MLNVRVIIGIVFLIISAVAFIMLPVYSENSKGIVEIFWQNVTVDIVTFLFALYFILRGILLGRRRK